MVKMPFEKANRMNPFGKLFLLIICLLSLAGCDDSGSKVDKLTPDSTTPEQIGKFEESRIIDSGKNYTVYVLYDDDEEGWLFYYRIELYDDAGKCIFETGFDFPEPKVQYVSEDVIVIDKHTGTGCSEVQYCDIKRGLVSEKYDITEPILFVDGKLIQRGNGQGLTISVTDVFDKPEYYKQLIIDAEPFALETMRLVDEQTIEIKYLRYEENGDFTEKTASISLDQLQ